MTPSFDQTEFLELNVPSGIELEGFCSDARQRDSVGMLRPFGLPTVRLVAGPFERPRSHGFRRGTRNRHRDGNLLVSRGSVAVTGHLITPQSDGELVPELGQGYEFGVRGTHDDIDGLFASAGRKLQLPERLRMTARDQGARNSDQERCGA